ncbi:MAG: polysaccharide deacetylase family protein [Mailhella sp.]|nr:polysaccharide deacetylase family protein [Mailhella sp.]
MRIPQSVLHAVLVSALAAATAVDAGAAPAGEWAPARTDERKAVPNDPSPPARTEPRHVLPPLGKDEEGTIRRVELPEGVKAVAFTFDMCELSTVTTGCDMDVIAVLREEGIPATLFMGGKWMRTHAGRVRQLMREPLFEIGNHAWTHGNFGIMDAESMQEQIRFTQAQYEILRQEALREAGLPEEGDSAPVPKLFRFPYGRCCDEALAVVAANGMKAVQWSVVGEDGGDSSSRGNVQDVLRRIRPGDIILCHANRVPKGTAGLVKAVAGELRRRGYRFVTAGELLEMGKPQRTRNGYFMVPGDNLPLDTKFGIDGTGRRN